VIANQSGDGNYSAAPQVTQSVTADKAAPIVTLTGAPPSAPYQATFTVMATSNSGVTPTIAAAGACSISGTYGLGGAGCQSSQHNDHDHQQPSQSLEDWKAGVGTLHRNASDEL
jgi:hypothetical protein